jgi:hypothetical protein
MLTGQIGIVGRQMAQIALAAWDKRPAAFEDLCDLGCRCLGWFSKMLETRMIPCTGVGQVGGDEEGLCKFCGGWIARG